jgi:hypothetical protein
VNPSALRPATRLLLLAIGEGAVAWSHAVVLPDSWFLGLYLAIGALAVVLWPTMGQWRTRRVVADALREHRDPDQAHLGEVFQSARVALAVPRWWLTSLLAGALAVTMLVVAIVRAEPVDALPGLLLLGWGAAAFVVLRRAGRLAERWLDDPPAPDPAEIAA